MGKLNESIFQYLNTTYGDDEAANDNIRAAQKDRENIRKRTKKDFSDKEKEMSDFVKLTNRRETKPMKNTNLKKLHLSESIFEDTSKDFYYKKKRKPVAEIIQDELTDGEKGYLKNGDSWSPTNAPHMGMETQQVGLNANFDIEVYTNDEQRAKDIVKVGEKYGKRVKYDKLHSPYSDRNHKVTIYLDDGDWDVPYFDDDVTHR